jgi:hypothetical protein
MSLYDLNSRLNDIYLKFFFKPRCEVVETAPLQAAVSGFSIDLMGYRNQPRSQVVDDRKEDFMKYVNSPTHANCEIMVFWPNDGTALYPNLVEMARFYLAMPISQTADEQSFSISKRTLTAERACLSPATLNMLMCLKSWMTTGILEEEEIFNIYKTTGRE